MQDMPPVSPGRENFKNYFGSSAELKDGLEVLELDTDDLPLAFRQAWNLV
jgi:hypothetical protein